MAEPHIPVRMNYLCCQICKELLSSPATVPCGHNFCTQCIQDRWDRDERTNRPCSCPECGQRFLSRPQLIRNTTLAEVVRDTGRLDVNKRKQQQTEESQQVQKRPRSGAETSGSARCWRHSSPLDLYCCTDERVICASCASAEHGGHKIGCVSEERRRKQEEVKNMQKECKQIIQKQEKKLEKMEKMLEQIQKKARQTEDYCESVIVSVIDSLQKHYLSIRKQIEAQEEAAAAQVRMWPQTLQVKVDKMKEWDAELDCLAQAESDVHFLQEWPSLQLLCENDQLQSFQEDSEDPLLPFEDTKRATEQLSRQLVELCDKEFASICQSAGGGEQLESAGETEDDDMQPTFEASISQSCGLSGVTTTEQSLEPKTREQFLQYACEISLDPSTAHEDLAVSEGDKVVMLCPQKSKRPALRFPHKFVHRRQVLCREGLQAERCYYEVEVKGDKAEVALAYKGIDRKSSTKRSAFGGNAISWSLDRSTSYSVSHNDSSVQLTTTPTHHKIGIYLRFKEGTLSFYEVSQDSMRFLYKAEAKFTEPLYPGFWLGEKCCIRICDLRQRRL